MFIYVYNNQKPQITTHNIFLPTYILIPQLIHKFGLLPSKYFMKIEGYEDQFYL